MIQPCQRPSLPLKMLASPAVRFWAMAHSLARSASILSRATDPAQPSQATSGDVGASSNNLAWSDTAAVTRRRGIGIGSNDDTGAGDTGAGDTGAGEPAPRGRLT